MRRFLIRRNIIIIIIVLLFFAFSLKTNSTFVKNANTQITKAPKIETIEPTKQVYGARTAPSKTTPPSDTKQRNGQEAQVIKVVDGDTIQVSLGGNSKTIRVIGINTPETVDPRKPVECFGKEASAKAKELLNGQTVLLEADASQTNLDKYQRLLRYVFLSAGTVDYGKAMIQEGYAYEYTYNYPYKYQAAYKLAEQQAQTGKKGLWGDSICENIPVTQQGSVNTTQTKTQTSSSDSDKDCKDFKTQAEAQSYFNAKGGSSTNNVDKLDGGDHDGLVCESLP